LKSEGGRGEIGGILAYARQVHKDDKYLGELCHAAEVFQTLSAQTAGLSPQFLDKAKHLAAIHKAPRETWPVLTGTLLEQS
jgi:hypothetical protein